MKDKPAGTIREKPVPWISVIIPALNEADQIGSLIRRLRRYSRDDNVEIIVVDGRSEDGTAMTALNAGARVMTALEKGRAVQMNIGADAARGQVLYFLHADTLPSRHFDEYISRAVREGYGAGSFRLDFDEDSSMLRFYSWFTRLDINAFRFGDQSLFVDSQLFDDIGGYDESLLVMEDNEIIYRLRKQCMFKVMPAAVTTSARRYRRNGVIKLQIIFTLIYILYHIGASQQVLAHFYRSWIK